MIQNPEICKGCLESFWFDHGIKDCEHCENGSAKRLRNLMPYCWDCIYLGTECDGITDDCEEMCEDFEKIS
jgi:hypothetical protein